MLWLSPRLENVGAVRKFITAGIFPTFLAAIGDDPARVFALEIVADHMNLVQGALPCVAA